MGVLGDGLAASLDEVPCAIALVLVVIWGTWVLPFRGIRATSDGGGTGRCLHARVGNLDLLLSVVLEPTLGLWLNSPGVT